MSKQNKLQITAVLRQLDERNFKLYRSHKGDEAARKELDQMLGFVLPLWMSDSPKDADHAELVYRFNKVANPGWYQLRKHPELQMKLLAFVGLGRQVRHAFHNPAVRVIPVSNLMELLRDEYQDIRLQEVRLWCKQNGEPALRLLMQRYGVQEDRSEAILKEYHKYVVEAV